MQSPLIAPHGGELVQLLAPLERCASLQADSRDWPSHTLEPQQLCDVELLLVGAFSPLRGFLRRADYDSVCEHMRLADGTLWPLPITLDIEAELAEGLSPGAMLALREPEGAMVAALHVEELWQPDRGAEARAILGTEDPSHPGVAALAAHPQRWLVGGRIEGLRPVSHYDHRSLRFTPDELRAEFIRAGWRKVAAYPSLGTMHRSHLEKSLRAARGAGVNLLLQPVIGLNCASEASFHTRVRCFEALIRHYPPNSARLALLELAPRFAGPREALLHAILAKNHGCSHILIERDHASPGGEAEDGGSQSGFYPPEAAQETLAQHEEELGVTSLATEPMVYLEEQDSFVPISEAPADGRPLRITREELQSRLADGREIPSWFTYPEIVHELRGVHPPRHRQGFTVFFTGLSGAGKSTIANILMIRLLEMGGRPVTLLDGDIVRHNLSSELGFSKEHRDINILRIGFVASEITKNGGIAICAPIAPYESVRRRVRRTIEACGGFVLVHVATPLEICETRDVKGLYAKARAGIIKTFTGISDPYEPPSQVEISIDTSDISPAAAAQEVLLYLERTGFIGDPAHSP